MEFKINHRVDMDPEQIDAMFSDFPNVVLIDSMIRLEINSPIFVPCVCENDNALSLFLSIPSIPYKTTYDEYKHQEKLLNVYAKALCRCTNLRRLICKRRTHTSRIYMH